MLPDIEEATEEDWYREYLDLILAVSVVRYGRGHRPYRTIRFPAHGIHHHHDYANSQRFLNEVNSSTVLVNASTRFSDGFELGLGAEIGISTTKLHAFGPMGLEELTTTKFIIYGNGQVRT